LLQHFDRRRLDVESRRTKRRRWSYLSTGGVIAARAAPGSIGTLCRRQRLTDNLAEIGNPRKHIRC
jgi:hypothetical protein